MANRTICQIPKRSQSNAGGIMHDTTEYLLEQWGHWVRQHSLKLESKNVLGNLHGSTVPTPLITDDEALHIDKTVAKLKRRDPEMGTALCMYYINRQPYRRIAQALGRSLPVTHRLVATAVAWVDGALNAKPKEA
ncbi:MAG: hypothetical protein D6706_07095 [Chloroflexi bacterium]|nr:MAG: hypothetical protein D6706_07095 [Chloroflexota bacterium]